MIQPHVIHHVDLDKLAGDLPDECESLTVTWSDGTSLTAEICQGDVQGAYFDDSHFDLIEGHDVGSSEWLSRELKETPNADTYWVGSWVDVL